MERVTAYCRVSTDKDDQLNSLENQEKYFVDYINANPDWEYVPLYADEGLSGTSTKKRKNFNRMIADAALSKFDLILTKEVSRFARNTVDTLHFTRELINLGVGVIFLTDNLNTRDPDGEFRLTIMAGIAQDESRRTSQRVKWGQSRSMEKGVVFGHTLLGYNIVEGKLIINPIEAATVRLIFDKYLKEAKGLSTIAKELEREGILTSYGKKGWDATSVMRILQNEKYCGDLKQKKFITPNYLTHQTRRNKGEEEFVVLRDNHEAIISREVFDEVQAETARRGALNSVNKRYTNRYAFSGKLVCGMCGDSFTSSNIRRTSQVSGATKVIKRWRCTRSRLQGCKKSNPEKGCDNLMVRNEILEHVFQLALLDVVNNKDVIIHECVKILAGVLDADQIQDDYRSAMVEMERLTSRIDKLLDLYVDDLISKDELRVKREPLDRQISALQVKLNQLSNNANLIKQRDALIDNIKSHVTDIIYAKKFSDEVASEMLDHIVIYGKDRFDVHFYGVTDNFFFSV